MPTLYRYLGFIIQFYANDHLPVHVHVTKGGKESVIELIFQGKILTLNVRKAKGMTPVSDAELKIVKEFITTEQDEIVESWKNYYIRQIPIKTKIISQRKRK